MYLTYEVLSACSFSAGVKAIPICTRSTYANC